MKKERLNTGYVYYRVSDDKQLEGYSLDQQKKKCENLAKSKGIKIIGYFVDEGESATTNNRKQFLQMLNECEKKKVGYVLVYHTDRFARNNFDHHFTKKLLERLDITLLSVTQPMIDDSPEGKLLDAVMAAINQFYSDDLSRKTMNGMYGRWASGWWVSGAPHGYMNVNKDGQIAKRAFTKEKQKYLEGLGRAPYPVEIDPYTSPYIKEMFQLYATNNYSYFNLGQFLFDKGLKTANGQPLAHSTIHQIITNPFYYGLMRWNDETQMGKHEPLIDKSLFDHCQLIAAKKRHFLIRKHKFDFLLRGVVFCDKCGQRYTAEWHKVKSSQRDKIGYYHCAKQKPCKSPYIEVEELEGLVEQQLHDLRFTEEFVQLLTNKVREYLDTIDQTNSEKEHVLIKRRAELKKQKSELLNYLVNKVIDQDDFAEKKAELDSEITTINMDITKIEKSGNFDFDLLEEVLKLTLDIPASYAEAPTELKRQYLRFFFKKITADNKEIKKVEHSDLIQELINCKLVIGLSTKLPAIEKVRNCFLMY